ncbi:MAG: DUF3500 domain-containing protein [Planctomycetota bacterium]|nr:DUF3500 domain-containing protein [Planctomycetota bacterium]
MRARLVLLLASTLSLSWGWAHQDPARTPAEAVAAAARAVLESMTPEQKARAQFSLAAAERADWHFTPRERPGIPLLELTAEQRIAVGLLLRAALGNDGQAQIGKVQELDTVLREMAERRGQKADYRNPLLYELAVFGEPSANAPWAFRFEGHHVSITVATDGHGAFGFSPCFLGANPLRVPEGEREGQRVLAAREDTARALFRSLSAEQRRVAHVAVEAPRELLLPPGTPLHRLDPAGIAGKQLDEAQRRDLLLLISCFLGDVHPELGGHALLEQAREQVEEIHFAWMGSYERGAAHGFRVQTPRLVIEWTTAMGDSNHVHAGWRDLERDLSLGWGVPQAEAR